MASNPAGRIPRAIGIEFALPLSRRYPEQSRGCLAATQGMTSANEAAAMPEMRAAQPLVQCID